MKGNKLSTSTIVAIIILLISAVSMFLLLNLTAKSQKARTNNFNQITSTDLLTTTNEADIVVDELPQEENEETPQQEIKAVNFSSSIKDILSGYEEIGDYKIELVYNGALFNFNCTSYDQDTNTCKSGSALMNTGSAVLPLYSYDKEEDNYYNHPEDFYIIIKDDNIIITTNTAGKKAGSIKIYDSKGNIKHEIPNVITGFIESEVLDNEYYPNISEEDGNMYYYVCDNNTVKINGVSFNDLKTNIRDEVVPGTRCY